MPIVIVNVRYERTSYLFNAHYLVTGFTTASAPGVAQLEYGHLSFHCAPHGQVLHLL